MRTFLKRLHELTLSITACHKQNWIIGAIIYFKEWDKLSEEERVARFPQIKAEEPWRTDLRNDETMSKQNNANFRGVLLPNTSK